VKKLGLHQIRSTRNPSIVYEFACRDLQEDASKPNGPVVVILEGKIVGKIRPVEGGYAYQPKNAGVVGETFTTLRACQKSLETE
jgi:hypothetical protein